MNIQEKAKTILTGVINKIENTGNLKPCVHIYNIAVNLNNQTPKSVIDRAISGLFDIVDGINKKNPDIKIIKEYLKKVYLR